MAPIDPNPDSKAEHGPRLSPEEYRRRIVALHDAAPESGGETALERREFDLRLDHRLGTRFPAQRRERLWAAHQAFQRRRWLHLLRGLLPGSGGPSAALAAGLARAYARELDADELGNCLGLAPGELNRLLRRR